jgi:hypothetical protein
LHIASVVVYSGRIQERKVPSIHKNPPISAWSISAGEGSPFMSTRFRLRCAAVNVSCTAVISEGSRTVLDGSLNLVYNVANPLKTSQASYRMDHSARTTFPCI